MLQNKSNETADSGAELLRNRAVLRSVNSFFNSASIVYAATCIFYAAISIFVIIIFPADSFFDTFFVFLDGIVLKGAVLYFGYQSCYRHNFRMTFLPFVVQAVDFSMMTAVTSAGIGGLPAALGVTIDLILLGMYAFLTILIVINNKKYKFLEEQEGFPYFNERVEEVKEERRQFETDNPFIKRKKELERNRSENMDLLDYSQRSGDNGSNDATGRGTMDEI